MESYLYHCSLNSAWRSKCATWVYWKLSGVKRVSNTPCEVSREICLPCTLRIREIGRGCGDLFAGAPSAMFFVVAKTSLTSCGIPCLGMKAERAELIAFQRWVQMMHLFLSILSAELFLQSTRERQRGISKIKFGLIRFIYSLVGYIYIYVSQVVACTFKSQWTRLNLYAGHQLNLNVFISYNQVEFWPRSKLAKEFCT